MDEIANRKSWFNRNWKWVVPTGGCLLIIIAFIVFAGSMIVGLTSLFEDSAPYKEALKLARQDQQVIEALGEPLEKAGAIKGSFTLSNNEGHANFDIPVEGPLGKGVLYVEADQVGSDWVYHTLEVVVERSLDTIRIDAPRAVQ